MTSNDWHTSEDARFMLDVLQGPSQFGGSWRRYCRKLRLFSCALWRGVAEVLLRDHSDTEDLVATATRMEAEALVAEKFAELSWRTVPPRQYRKHPLFHWDGMVVARRVVNVGTTNLITEAGKADLLREVLGDPFCPVVREAHWLTPDVLSLTNYAYESGDYTTLQALADALEEAGCTHQEVLRHLRGFDAPCETCEVAREAGGVKTMLRISGFTISVNGESLGPTHLPGCVHCHGTGRKVVRKRHARGCWVLDVILGKQ